MAFRAVFAIVLGYACGAAEMAVLGERFGARIDEVAAAQSVRILMVVLIIPSVFVLLKLHGADAFSTGTPDIRWRGTCTTSCRHGRGGIRFATRARIERLCTGALAVAIPLTVSEVYLSAMPRWLLNGAQLLLGCALGARFNRSFLRRAPRFVAAVAVCVIVAMTLSTLFAVALAGMTGIHTVTLVLATAPGDIAGMAVTAKVVELGVRSSRHSMLLA